jgi:hypothetical protein
MGNLNTYVELSFHKVAYTKYDVPGFVEWMDFIPFHGAVVAAVPIKNCVCRCFGLLCMSAPYVKCKVFMAMKIHVAF